MNEPECLKWAVGLLDRGLWPCLIYPPGVERNGQNSLTRGKEPVGKNWGAARKTRDELCDLVAWARVEGFQPHGVGVCLGPKRAPGGRWLIDIEVDGPKGEASIAMLLGSSPVATCGWSSLRGVHRLFIADGHELVALLDRANAHVDVGAGDDAETAKMRDLIERVECQGSSVANGDPEKRWQGAYVLDDLPDVEFRVGRRFGPEGKPLQMMTIVPPTPNLNGTPRRWNGIDVISDLPQDAYEFLEKIGARKPTFCLDY